MKEFLEMIVRLVLLRGVTVHVLTCMRDMYHTASLKAHPTCKNYIMVISL